VVGEDLSIKDQADNIDAAAEEKEEDITISPVRSCSLGGIGMTCEKWGRQSSNAHAKAGNVRHSRDRARKRSHDCRFNDEAGTAAGECSHHKGFAANTVHDACLEPRIRTGAGTFSWPLLEVEAVLTPSRFEGIAIEIHPHCRIS
jgi:hypothetical protein